MQVRPIETDMKKSPTWKTEQGEEYRMDNGTTIERDEYRIPIQDYMVRRFIQKNNLDK